jgi:hypothetical protein
MKHKVAELEGALLDAAVAKAEGLAVASVDDIRGCLRQCEDGVARHYGPSYQWDEGGPIIEREQGAFYPDRWADESVIWVARMGGGNTRYQELGPTPLIAAMRAYVASRFGPEIEME